MTSLASCDAASVEQAGRVLAGCADSTEDATVACRRAAHATWRWRGPAQRSFDAALGALEHQLSAIESVHREASAVLRQYVDALYSAMAQARRADALDREADALSAAFRRASAVAAAPLYGPDPGEAVRAQAAAVRRGAEDEHEIAASLAAAQLNGLADRAPSAPRLAATGRFMDDFGSALGGSAVGLGQLAVLAGESIGIGHREQAARRDLWQAAKDTVKVWQPVSDMWHDLTGGRPGSAFGGAAAMAFGPGKLSEFRGHRIRDPHLAHKEALREAQRRDAVAAHVIWRSSAKDLGALGTSLVNEEARGGHAWEKHVAAPRGYLLARNRAGWNRAGTFRDLATAERLVNEVLREHADALHQVYELPPRRGLRLVSTFPFTTGRVTVPGSSRTVPARAVVVVLRLEGGEPHVYTAFPEL